MTVPYDSKIKMPLLGTRAVAHHQRLLMMVFAISLAVLAASIFWILAQSERAAGQLNATGQSLLNSERLAKSATQALAGNASAFANLSESAESFLKNTRALRGGDSGLGITAVSGDLADSVMIMMPSVDKTEKYTKTIIEQKKYIIDLGGALKAVTRKTSDLLEVAELVAASKLRQNASAQEVSAAEQLAVLTQRIGKSANELLSFEGVSAEAVFLLEKDLNSFKNLGLGLKDGNPELKLKPAKDKETVAQLEQLIQLFDDIQGQAKTILGNLQGIASARDAHNGLLVESELLRKKLETLHAKLTSQAGADAWLFWVLALAALLAIAAAIGLAYLQVLEGRQRQLEAEKAAELAQGQEVESKRVSNANQAAILRLMNELQNVADGDLTQEATVTEDITGAIADSVNYTVEELRVLVGNVQKTSSQVALTTDKVEASSSQLLAVAVKQLDDIQMVEKSMTAMAERMSQTSGLADESANVARQFLAAANSGLSAVQSTMSGMNTIRDQIQETAKRMKRLGESSQEIGEITDLISDITEQTNVLALNAAIQAASAGEAGRGFTVVAEEVQRLAERSADATRQIANLVKAIQADTHDVVASMERSTQGVVSGAQLSENAGLALANIDLISKQLTALIERISSSTSHEAQEANTVATTIQTIFNVTQRTSDGTKDNAQMVRELSLMADELKKSVARFKLA